MSYDYKMQVDLGASTNISAPAEGFHDILIEGKTYEIQEGFVFDVDSYERQSNGKGDMVNRGQKKVLNIKYTPDFISDSFIIECKGRANESFPIRWKMFKEYVNKHLKHVILYKPQNQKECDEVIKLILTKQNKIK